MNILYVVTSFPKLSESFVLNEVYELEQRGHEVSVFAMDDPDESVIHEEIESLDLDVYYGEKPTLRSFPDLLSRRVFDPAVIRRAAFIEDPRRHAYYLHLGKQISRAVDAAGGVEVLHAHFATPDRIAVAYAAVYHDIPCTVTAHAHEIFTPSSERRLQRVCDRFDHIVVPTEYNKRYLKEKFSTDTEMTVVPATTNVEKFETSQGCVSGRLLTVARLVEKKGHEYAIDAVADLVEQGHDIEYHIVGSGDREEYLRDRAKECGVGEHVEFLGHVSDEQLRTELQEAELFVLPCVIAVDGDRDAAPVALKEAMATKTACISTNVSGIPELIVDGREGILVEPRNPTAISDAIGMLLDNPKRRREIEENAKRAVDTRFNISNSVSELLDVFRTARQRQ